MSMIVNKYEKQNKATKLEKKVIAEGSKIFLQFFVLIYSHVPKSNRI